MNYEIECMYLFWVKQQNSRIETEKEWEMCP